jgi:uncharacterized protein (TIGR02246 family)
MDPVQEQLDAYNARDLERFLACYAPDVVVESAAGQRMMEGREGMRAVYAGLFANSPALHAEVLTRIAVGAFVVDEERVRGLNLPGFPSEMHAAMVYEVRDGQIVHVRLLA